MRRTVLLIDDQEDSLVIYRCVLEHCGYHVLLARTPEAGVALARETSPDVIITELFQRTESGWYTPEALRSDSRTCHIPILALSSSCLAGDRERALCSGCTHFLAKPIPPTLLSNAISVLVDLPCEPMPPAAG